MRVTHQHAEDWFDDLDADHAAGQVWQNEVRVDLRKHPEQPEAISYQMQIWGTYIRNAGEDKLVVELDLLLGSTFDFAESDADKLYDEICDRALNAGLQVRPGKIEFA